MQENKMNSLVFFIVFSLFISLSNCDIEFDFCVGDISRQTSPVEYACKNPTTVTIDDFIFTGFRGQKTTTNIYKANATLAFANIFPGLNGLGIATSRVDLSVGGVIPAHTHRTSEFIIVVKGSIIAGFVDTNNTAYFKRLEVGDVMVFPPTLVHFQVNAGTTSATAYSGYNGANPGVQLITNSLLAGNLPTDLITRMTLVNPSEIARLKLLFGITNV